MGRVDIDASEVLALAADLGAATARLVPQVRAVVTRGAVNVKAHLRSEAGRSPSFRHIAPTIGYDQRRDTATSSEVEVGPGKPTGALANIAYFGGAHGGGATLPDPQGALDAEGPRFEQALTDILGDLL